MNIFIFRHKQEHRLRLTYNTLTQYIVSFLTQHLNNPQFYHSKKKIDNRKTKCSYLNYQTENDGETIKLRVFSKNICVIDWPY